jgi:hypothetical protein
VDKCLSLVSGPYDHHTLAFNYNAIMDSSISCWLVGCFFLDFGCLTLDLACLLKGQYYVFITPMLSSMEHNVVVSACLARGVLLSELMFLKNMFLLP